LDCIEKLLAYGYLQHSADDSALNNDGCDRHLRQHLVAAYSQVLTTAPPGRGKLIDKAIDSTCECFALQDEYVQLQIIQVLLTGVTTKHSGVHDASLLAAVRTVYNIFLNSKNLVGPDCFHNCITRYNPISVRRLMFKQRMVLFNKWWMQCIDGWREMVE
jgi:hypothetical protein